MLACRDALLNLLLLLRGQLGSFELADGHRSHEEVDEVRGGAQHAEITHLIQDGTEVDGQTLQYATAHARVEHNGTVEK